MKRNEHTFQFTGRAISEAAHAEWKYHMDRLAYWREEQDKAIQRAREAGLEVQEFDVTGGKSVQIVVDPSVTNRLNECARKTNDHRQAADRFQIEAAAYGTQPDRAYELHPEDVVYFRLAGGARPE